MRDWNSAIRTAYMALLNSVGGGIGAYYMMIPTTVNPGNKYYLLTSITAVEESDKNSFDGRVSVLVDCVALGNDIPNTTDSETMVSSLKGLINSQTQPNLAPNFVCVTTNITSDEQLLTKASDKTVLRRLIRFEHYIGQIQ